MIIHPKTQVNYSHRCIDMATVRAPSGMGIGSLGDVEFQSLLSIDIVNKGIIEFLHARNPYHHCLE